MALSESGFGEWRVAFLHFADSATIEDVNEELAKRPGWEPFSMETHPQGGWVLYLRKQVEK